jgi:hypothetical protein
MEKSLTNVACQIWAALIADAQVYPEEMWSHMAVWEPMSHESAGFQVRALVRPWGIRWQSSLNNHPW